MSLVGAVVAGSVEALLDRRPSVVPSRCSRAASPKSRCSSCLRSCPVGSVSLGAKGPSVDERCVGCDACVAVCPADVFSRSTQTDEQLLDKLLANAAGSALTISCASTAHGSGVVCLGRLNHLLLLHLAAAGVSTIVLDTAQCGTCALVRGLSHLGSHIDAGVRLAQAIGVEMKVIRSAPEPCCRPASAHVARRALFGFFQRHADTPRAPLAAHLMAEHLRSSATALLSTRLVAPVEPTHACWPFHAVGIDASKCSGCTACSAVCSVSAMTREELPSGVRLCHEPGQCTGCGACVSACRWGALAIGTARLDQVLRGRVRLAEASGHRCALCGMLAPGQTDQPCPLCDRRSRMLADDGVAGARTA